VALRGLDGLAINFPALLKNLLGRLWIYDGE
jgi:hypothetical protein